MSSKLFNYADDSTSDNKGKNSSEIIEALEEDARGILEFMASNGLIANKEKTVLLLCN